MNARSLILRIHNEIGMSDNDIAYCLDVSREHINRIKNGKTTASEELTNQLNWLINELHTDNYVPDRKHYERKQNHRTPNNQFIYQNVTPIRKTSKQIQPAKSTVVNKPYCEVCKTTSQVYFYSVLNGNYCVYHALLKGQISHN